MTYEIHEITGTYRFRQTEKPFENRTAAETYMKNFLKAHKSEYVWEDDEDGFDATDIMAKMGKTLRHFVIEPTS